MQIQTCMRVRDERCGFRLVYTHGIGMRGADPDLCVRMVLGLEVWIQT